VLFLIAEDNRGNTLVEEKCSGKAFLVLDIPVQEQLEEEDEEEE
jgi:hypothetical protein